MMRCHASSGRDSGACGGRATALHAVLLVLFEQRCTLNER